MCKLGPYPWSVGQKEYHCFTAGNHARAGIKALRSFPDKFIRGAGIQHPCDESDGTCVSPPANRSLQRTFPWMVVTSMNDYTGI